MGDKGKGLEQLTRELEYYKRQLDELAGTNVNLDYLLAGLRRELRQRRQGFALLSGLQQHISVESQLSSIFEFTVSAINPILGMDKSAVLVPEGRESHFRPSHWRGFHEGEDERLASLCLELPEELSRGTGLLLVNRSFTPTPLSESLREALGLPYFICVPIMMDQAPVGLLLAGRYREALPFHPPLDQGDVDTFQAIAGMISSSLSIRRLAILEQMHRLQTEFFANISHEFRTPLMLTLGPLEQVLKGRHGDVPGAVRGQLQLMHRNQQRLLKLINQLLDLARLEAGGMPLKSRAVRDINALIKRRLLPFFALAEQSGVGLRFLPDSRAREAELFLDLEMFDKLLSNLLSNAFKFTRRGEVEVATEIVNGVFNLYVRDTGIGIRQDQLPHLFTRFRQADGSASREYAGTGIGLSLVKEIAKLHGGEVSVSSEYGKGSTFRVGFPLGKARSGQGVSTGEVEDESESSLEESTERPDDVAEDREAVRRLNQATEEELDPSKPLLVYAEDNPALREHVRSLLVPHYHVLLAVDGLDALALVRRWQPALILSDHMMPNMSGAELLAALRREEALRRIPVVLLTARASTRERLESLESGADDYLMKPFHEGELLARIKNLVQARAQERELARLHQQLEAKHAELQRAQAELIQSEKMVSMGRMTAGISHELKNPLNFIINFAEMNVVSAQELSELLESGAAPRSADVKGTLGALKEGSEQIVKHGHRANTIVQGMLRHFAGGSSGSREPTDLNALLTECITLVSQSHRAQQSTVEVALEQALDPSIGTLALVPQQLQRVFLNLLDNAFDAVRDKARSSGGDYAPQVVVSTRQGTEGVEIRIRDNGPGIPAAIRDRIFEPFFTTKLPGKGTGLGLWISYEIIVQGYQGTLSVESTEGAGAAFLIMLPRR